MWLLHPPKSRRRWHVFTWLVAVPVLVFVALVQVAGVEQLQSYRTQPDGVVDIQLVYQHGWPTPWLDRILHYRSDPISPTASSLPPFRNTRDGHLHTEPLRFRGHSVEWGSRHAWPVSANSWKIAPLGLFLNLLVATALVLAPMACAEIWLRRRGGPLRFKIIDFLAVALLIAGGFGLWRWDRGIVERERQLANELGFDTSLASQSYRQLTITYVGPDFLSRLCGNSHLVPLFQRITSLFVARELIGDIDFEKLSKLEHMTTAHVAFRDSSDPVVPTYGLDLFVLAPQVNTVFLHYLPSHQPELPLSQYELLENIEHVGIYGQLSVEEVMKLRPMPRLRTLSLFTAHFTPDELAAVRDGFPGVMVDSLDDGKPRSP